MKSGISINSESLIFKSYPVDEIGIAKYCRSFNLPLNDIHLIAISPRLALDDEVLFVLIVDLEGNFHPMPDNIIDSEGIKDFLAHFGLKDLNEYWWDKFEYEDHYGKFDKIIYPEKYFWENLFEDDWKLKARQLYSWANPKSFAGNINKKVTLGNKS